MTLKERTYLTSDRSLAVREGDRRAAFLLGVAGTVIKDELAKKLGLLEADSATATESGSPGPIPEVSHRETGVTFKRRGRSKSE